MEYLADIEGALEAIFSATIVSVAAVAILAFLTWRQIGLYSDEITLYRETLEKNPNCWMAHNNLSIILSNLKQTQEAIDHCHEALRLNPICPRPTTISATYFTIPAAYRKQLNLIKKQSD